jgi:hypothetical protein
MAKKPPPAPIIRGRIVDGPRCDEEGRVFYEIVYDDPPAEPEPPPPTDTLKRAMIVAIVRRDFRRRQFSIAEVHRHIHNNKAAVWKVECARQTPPVMLGAPGRDTIAYALEGAGLIKRKPRA